MQCEKNSDPTTLKIVQSELGIHFPNTCDDDAIEVWSICKKLPISIPIHLDCSCSASTQPCYCQGRNLLVAIRSKEVLSQSPELNMQSNSLFWSQRRLCKPKQQTGKSQSHVFKSVTAKINYDIIFSIYTTCFSNNIAS